jgi:BirA family transcriptional regulator, biotin operon repressor / biotin---[acetyl-CoA-carboxylase] ligase
MDCGRVEMALNLEAVRELMPGRRIEWHSSIPTTMTEAARLAAESCVSGTVVAADEQTAGHGRYGRAWHSEAGAGLYVSMVLRYAFRPIEIPVVTLALGLAAVEAIGSSTGLACDLRWPNDVLIHFKKCGGILAQMEGTAIVAGVGINVNHAAFPNDLDQIATSLRIASGGKNHSREQLLVELVNGIEKYCSLLEAEGRAPILEMFARASSFVNGRRVEVDLGSAVVRGTTAGLNDAGFLILRRDDGTESVVMNGGVRPCS